MIRRFLGIFVVLCGIVSSVFAYTPTAQDDALLGIIETKIDELSLVQAVQISTLVAGVMDRFEEGSKKHWYGQSILSYMADGILATPEVVVGPTVTKGDRISVNYVGSLEDGSVFDTSLEDVARQSGIYNDMRPYEPLMFTVGAGQMIIGFDEGVVGMVVGETKIMTLSPEYAYGYEDHFLAGKTLIFEVTIIDIDNDVPVG